LTFNGLHGVISQKIVIVMEVFATRIISFLTRSVSNHTKSYVHRTNSSFRNWYSLSCAGNSPSSYATRTYIAVFTRAPR
jgi:hypothetical protein